MSESESASAPSKADENDIAIELAAQELKLNPKITRLKLYTQLFGSRKERAPHVKDKVWATRWTPSRLKNKVWKLARERAGLGPIARGGAPRQTT